MGAWITLLGLSACTKQTSPVDDRTDTASVDTEWVDTAEEVVLESIALHPARILVDPGAELTLRAVGTYSDGHSAQLPDLELSSDDAAVSAEGLRFTALEAGSATLSVALDGVVAESLVEVQDTGLLSVQVVSEDLQPVSHARVIWQGEKRIADEMGIIALPTDTGGPVSFTVFAQDPDLVPLTVYGVVSRRLSLSLSHVDTLLPAADLSARVDFSALDEAEPDELRLSLSGTALSVPPVLVSELDLIRPNREVTIFGAEVELPENLAIDEHAPEIALASAQAQTQAWTLAGTLPISELSSGVESFAELGVLLEALEPSLRLGTSAAVAHDGELSLSPATQPDGEVWVTLPSASEGSLVLLFAKEELGWVLQGLATGSSQVRIPSASGGREQVVVAWHEPGGAGSGVGRSMTMAPVVSGQAELPDWVRAPSHGGLSAATGDFILSTDPEAVFVQVLVQSADGGLREVLMPPGEQSASLAGDPAMRLGKTQWDVLAIHADSRHYQDILGEVGVRSSWVQGNTRAVGGLRAQVIGE